VTTTDQGGMIEPAASHTGSRREALSFTYALPEPVDHVEPPRWSRGREMTWRFFAVTVRFTRESEGGPGADWQPWRMSVTYAANNVLKSGDVGVIAPSAHDALLGTWDWRKREFVAAEWSGVWVQPLVDDATARAAAAAWEQPW